MGKTLDANVRLVFLDCSFCVSCYVWSENLSAEQTSKRKGERRKTKLTDKNDETTLRNYSPVVTSIMLIAICVGSVSTLSWMEVISISPHAPTPTSTFTIAIPPYQDATHATYQCKEYFFLFDSYYNQSDVVQRLPFNFTVETSWQHLRLDLTVHYYREISLNIYEDLGSKSYMIDVA